MRCNALKKSGDRCSKEAGDNGFCSQHDPRTPEEKQQAKKQKESQEARLQEVVGVVVNLSKVKAWDYYIESLDEANHRYATISVWQDISGEKIVGQVHLTVNNGVRVSIEKTSFHNYGLDALHKAIMIELEQLPWLEKKIDKAIQSSKLDTALNILNKFHSVVNQLKRRYDGRETLRVNDEYDVQDLLHALLKIDFDDVRPEEHSPSAAGSASRLDFLLKTEKIVIETKMTSSSLTDKKIGEQLIIDIERYRAHPDCKRLICMVYDPDHHLRNPVGLEKDLSRKEKDLEIVVVVVPK